MPGRYALLIGNSNFRHSELGRLSAPQDDVRDLAELLEDEGIAGFDDVDLKLDVGPYEAKEAIGRLFQGRHHEDVVLLYYSGHGLKDTRGRFYLATSATNPGNPDPGSIDRNWLLGEMNDSESRRQVTILDCCYSAALFPGGRTARDAGPVLTKQTFDPRGHGRYILASTTADMSAFEDNGRSIYTRHLIDGLRTGVSANKPNISVHDLHEFIVRRVAQDAPDIMRPQLWRDAELNPTADPLFIAHALDQRFLITDEIKNDLWSDQYRDLELSVFRLQEIIQRGRTSASEEARRLLAARVKDDTPIAYTIGIKIAHLLGEIPSAEEIAANRQATATVRELQTQLVDAKSRAAKEVDRLQLELEDVRDTASQERETLQRRLAESAGRLKRAVGAGLAFGKGLGSTRGLFVVTGVAVVALALFAPEALERAVSASIRLLNPSASGPDGGAEELEERVLNAEAERDAATVRVAELQGELETVSNDRDDAAEATAVLEVRERALSADLIAAQNLATALEAQVEAGRTELAETRQEAAELQLRVDAAATTMERLHDGVPAGAEIISGSDEPHLVFRDAGIPLAPEMVVIPAGEFTMGSTPEEHGHERDERPEREVAITRFALARTEVTFDQWEACVVDGGCNGYRPLDNGWGRGDRPVINVSWEDARAYIRWLNSNVDGAPYRLPTEAEWEYAARAWPVEGNETASSYEITQTAFPWGNEASHAYANYGTEAGRDGYAEGPDLWADETAPVASFPANGFGLQDMHGNVWEWVHDCKHDSYANAPVDGTAWLDEDGGNCDERGTRGGSWFSAPKYLRTANRGYAEPDDRAYYKGFRPARTLVGPW